MLRILWFIVFMVSVSCGWADVSITPSASWEVSVTCQSHEDSYLQSKLSLEMDISFTDNVTAHVSTLNRIGTKRASFDLRDSYVQLVTGKLNSDIATSRNITFTDNWEIDRYIGQPYYLAIDVTPSHITSPPVTKIQPDNYVSELVFNEFNYQSPTRYSLFEDA
jgi:hypothetical protein